MGHRLAKMDHFRTLMESSFIAEVAVKFKRFLCDTARYRNVELLSLNDIMDLKGLVRNVYEVQVDQHNSNHHRTTLFCLINVVFFLGFRGLNKKHISGRHLDVY